MAKEWVPDDLDAAILKHLQLDGRMTATALSRAVRLSVPAVTERVRRMEEAGIISGYGARVEPRRLGYDLKAFVRLKHTGNNYQPFRAMLERRHEILECEHITGEDCFIMKVIVSSMEHLEEVINEITKFGTVTTSLVYSAFLAPRPIRVPEHSKRI